MNRTVYLTLMLFSFLMKDVLSAKILAIMLVPSTSHFIWYTKYLEGLLHRGHAITYVGVEKLKSGHQNLRQVVFDRLHGDLFDKDFMLSSSSAGPIETALVLDRWDDTISNYIKKSDTFQQFLRIVKTENFDLVVHDIAESIFMLGALHFLEDTPVIGFTPFGRPYWALDILKNPTFYASHPHFLLPYADEMTFFERVHNFLFYVFTWGTRVLYMIEQNRHAKDAFGVEIQPLEKVLDKMNIIMVNSNEGVDFPYPKVPGLIPIGGLHIEPPKELPKDLKSYLDNATHGVIYLSLGTNVLSSSFSKEKVEILVNAFKQLSPVKVLWKWEEDEHPGKPDNVKLVKWAPQNDILAHPNVRIFFTHSGLLSTQEALYHGVPVLGMPFLLDQHANLKFCVHKGMAEELDFHTLSSEAILEKAKKLLSDSKYKENAKQLSAQFKDTMVRPLDRAVHWTEYAIRHKGAPHLSLQARKMAWFENTLLDVYLFLLLALLYVLFIVYKILQCIGRRIRNEQTKMKTS